VDLTDAIGPGAVQAVLTEYAPGHDGVAALGGSRILPISRRTSQRGATESVPARSAVHVVTAASAAESKNALDLGQTLGETTSYRNSRLCIRILTFALRGNTSEVSTVYVRIASTDLCGRCRATGIPTATEGLSTDWSEFSTVQPAAGRPVAGPGGPAQIRR